MSKKEETAIVSPNNMGAMSFSKQMEEYQRLSVVIVDQTASLAEIERKIRKLIGDHATNDFVNKYGTSELLYAEKYLEVQKKVDPESVDPLVSLGNKEAGYYFENIASRHKLMTALEKKFGKELTKYIRSVGELYDERSYNKYQEDTVKTKEVRVKYKDLLAEREKVMAELAKNQDSFKQLKEYVAFCKDLASIATSAKDLNV